MLGLEAFISRTHKQAFNTDSCTEKAKVETWMGLT